MVSKGEERIAYKLLSKFPAYNFFRGARKYEMRRQIG